MSIKLIKLADKDERASTWAVDDMLDCAKELIKEKPEFSKKAIIVFLDEENRQYATRILCAGIGKTSEIVALLEIEKMNQLKELGY